MKPPPQSAARGLWAIAWRAAVFLPMMLGIFLLLLGHLFGMVLPPIIGVVCFESGLWPYGLASFAGWLVLFWSWRHLRLHEHFRKPPSVL